MLLCCLALAGAALAGGKGSGDRLPDLVVKKISNPPAALTVGGSFSVTDTTANNGKRKAPATRTSFFLSEDEKSDKGDIELAADRSISKLKPDKASTGDSALGVPLRARVPRATSPGSYFVIACADGEDDAKEESERNNCRASGGVTDIGAAAGPPTDPPPIDPTPPVDPPVPPAPDTTPPDTAIDSGPAASSTTSNNDPAFTYSGSPAGDVDHFECKLDGAAFANCSNAGTSFTNVADASHTFQVRAVDAAGNADASPASRTWTIETVPPSAPLLTSTVPASPSNSSTTPNLKGSAEADATITIYTSSDCTTGLVASGTTSDLGGTGIQVTATANLTTTFRATATDAAGNVSTCSSGFSYTHDNTPPTAPSFTGSSPASPSKTSTLPKLNGTAEAGAAIDIYTSATCTTGSVSSGSTSDFEGVGIQVAVAANATTQFFATATDVANNVSPCSSGFSYTHDNTQPTAPSITGSSPLSPSNSDTSPEVSGTAESGSTVRIYSDGACTTQLAVGTAAAFQSPGITVNVSSNATTTLRATATDPAGNVSPCSSGFSYIHDSNAPNTTINSGPTGPLTEGGATTDTTPAFTFSSEAGATFQCRIDADAFVACNSGSFTAAFISPSNTVHTFEVIATDAVGNPDPTSATLNFRVRTDADADNFASTGTGGTDCNDSSVSINPAAIDNTVNGTDEDCDGIDGS